MTVRDNFPPLRERTLTLLVNLGGGSLRE